MHPFVLCVEANMLHYIPADCYLLSMRRLAFGIIHAPAIRGALLSFSHINTLVLYCVCVWISRIAFYAPSPHARICSEAATWPPRQMVYRDGILLILTPQCFISCLVSCSDMRTCGTAASAPKFEP